MPTLPPRSLREEGASRGQLVAPLALKEAGQGASWTDEQEKYVGKEPDLNYLLLISNTYEFLYN